MRKIVVFFAVFLEFTGVAMGQDYIFPVFPWGASPEEVIAVEGLPDEVDPGYKMLETMRNFGFTPEQEYIMTYNNKMIGEFPAKLEFSFLKQEKKLRGYDYSINFKNVVKFVKCLLDITEKITAAYGEPIKKSESDLRPGLPFITWEYENTRIFLHTITLDANGFNNLLKVSYYLINPETE
jgi:hypothetical protein